MLTVTELGRQYNLSRASILYYEKEGLLLPAKRSNNGYRWYGEKETKRLEAIVAYRSYGLPIQTIKTLLETNDASSQAQVLKAHFYQLEKEVTKLKEQQRAIVMLLQEPSLLENDSVTKERWVAIMKAAGFDEDAMQAWHQKFEEMEPSEHQRFLESLGIDEAEIQQIRRG